MKLRPDILCVCQACQSSCLENVTHCLAVGGTHLESELVQVLLDTAELTGLAARLLARNSDAFDGICGVCADLCERCALDCDGFVDAELALCADACRACADACRQHLSIAA